MEPYLQPGKILPLAYHKYSWVVAQELQSAVLEQDRNDTGCDHIVNCSLLTERELLTIHATVELVVQQVAEHKMVLNQHMKVPSTRQTGASSQC